MNNINNIKDDHLKNEVDSLKKIISRLRTENNSFLFSAIVKVQAELPVINKDTKAFGHQKYASFTEIIKQSRPILTKHGLSVIQYFDHNNDKPKLITRLCHNSGQFIESNINIPLPTYDKQNYLDYLKEFGKAITYLRRYSYNSIIGITIAEDIE